MHATYLMVIVGLEYSKTTFCGNAIGAVGGRGQLDAGAERSHRLLSYRSQWLRSAPAPSCHTPPSAPAALPQKAMLEYSHLKNTHSGTITRKIYCSFKTRWFVSRLLIWQKTAAEHWRTLPRKKRWSAVLRTLVLLHEHQKINVLQRSTNCVLL